MTQRPGSRSHLVAALLLTAILSAGPAASARTPILETSRHRYAQIPSKVCPIDWRRGPWFVKKLIKCAAAHWAVPGGARQALYIADRESHYFPRAYNPSGAEGIYQHMRWFWPGRARIYGFPGWSAFNARANIIVTMRMVHRGGWSPWGM